MMIYIFGDLRQLRSFELSRPAISQPKPLAQQPVKDVQDADPASTQQQRSQSQIARLPTPTSITFNNPFPTSSTPHTLTSSPGTTAVSASRKMSLPATTVSGHDTGRKMSLPAVLSGWGTNRSKERVATTSGGKSEEQRFADAITPLTRPPVLNFPMAPSPVAERRPSERRASLGRLPALTIVPPEPVYARSGRERVGGVREEVGPLERLPKEEEEEESEDDDDEDEGYTSEESFGSESESDDDDIAEADLSSDEKAARAKRRRRRERKRRRHRPLVIEVSEAFYDEHPSPEGPATAPDWFNERRRSVPETTATNAARRASVVNPSANPNANPLWPDFDGSVEGRPASDEDGQQTAMFIRPFKYGEGDCEDVYIARPGVGREGDKAADVERALAVNVSKRNSASVHGVGADKEEFDFDGLPPPQVKLRTECVIGVGGPAVVTGGENEEQPFVYPYHRPPSPAPSASTRSDLGSAIDRRGTYWLVKRWWWVLEKMQRRCSPQNVVEVFRRRSEESERGKEKERDGKGKEREREPRAQEEKCIPLQSRQTPSAPPTVSAQPPAQPPSQPQPTTMPPRRRRRRDRRKDKQRQQPPSTQQKRKRAIGPSAWRAGLRKVYLAVPAFAAPLTPVLNPLVGRAQWEIVVRSAAMAAVISVVVIGGLLGVPE